MPTAEQEKRRAPEALTVLEGSLSRALFQGLDTPLVALRATMESLGQEMLSGRQTVKPLRIDGVLREVDRLGKNVRELCELASPPVPLPLSCSLEEIVSAARAGLTPEQRRRVIAARAGLTPEQRRRVIAARAEPGAAIEVDGPLVSACLRRLIENALEATDGLVLVVARRERDRASFAVVDDAPSSLGPDWQPVPFHSTKPNQLGLGLTLTRRDVGILNGCLEFLSTPGGDTCVRITIPVKGG